MAHVAIHTNGSDKPALAPHVTRPAHWMRSALSSLDPFQEMAPFDIKETKDGYVFVTDVPGIKLADLDVSLTGRTLTVSGKRESQHEHKTETYHARERSYGSFARAFTLPDGADEKTVSADLRDGVLTIRFQKKPGLETKKVEIKPAGEKH